ncbi:MAG: DmsE family decaheme c-type cytochrome [Deltaproteobacteria bacterium]|nr:MAG: DmsE family decaheme c-type cytochrome [Deltaproteobacteria bacterium]
MSERPYRKPTRRLWKVLPLVLLLTACATGAIRERILTLPVIEGATYVGADTCAGCHEEISSSMDATVHGRLADFEVMGAEKGCESCHGPGSLHVDSGDASKILYFDRLTADETAAVCTKCHSDGNLMDWAHGEHALADLSCGDCHSIHAPEAAGSLKQNDPALCYSCHQEQQAKMNLPSHHPVKEGKMGCNSCHNPHGELATDEQARDLCLNCHSRYQGPFVFEHAPVEEGCNTCHDPHGAVANNLLQQNEPFLCLQCHESHFHAARGGASVDVKDVLAFDGRKLDALRTSDPAAYNNILTGGAAGQMTPGEALAAGYDVTVPFTNAHGEEGWRKAFLTRCTTCHSVVHGSDLPSQTVPVIDTNGDGYPDGGYGLTR